MAPEQTRTLTAPMRVEFDYTRSVGPTLAAFFTGLRERRIVAGRISDDRIIAPPPEFDPVTHEPVTDFVEVGPAGTVESWSWVPEPVADQPFDRPFAYALVRLDGATAPMLHAVDVASPDDIRVGMRVEPRWREETTGAITDIEAFVAAPAGDGDAEGAEEAWLGLAPSERGTSAEGGSDRGPLRGAGAPGDGTTLAPGDSAPGDGAALITPVKLDYQFAASPEESTFFRGMAEGRILGQRCPACGKVYVPPRGACPVDGVPTDEEVELPHTGTVTTFCIVNVPFLGQKITPPYVSAYVLLDGADIAFLHLILDVEAADVRMGMRVQAVWRPESEWGTTIENISHFAPTGEPDADYTTYQQHL